jgi:hypothetical protein
MVIIEIVGAALADEKGLGLLYRVEQRRDGVPWVHLIARSAVVTDMELFGVDNPATVVEWHLHEALAPHAVEPSPADQLAFQAQQLTAAVLATRVGLADRATAARLADDLAAAQDEAEAMRDRARDMKTAEINEIGETVTVAENQGLADLRALVASDETAIDGDRSIYRDQITNSVTA